MFNPILFNTSLFNKILVCSDGSEPALNAARTAAGIASKFGSEVILLNIFDDSLSALPYSEIGEPGICLDDFTQYASIVQQDIEQRTASVFNEAGVAFLPLREMGRPVEIILSVAERKSAGLIVMGSRGMGGFKRLMLGSVSDGITHHACSSVLIGRGQSAPFQRILLASDGSAGAHHAAAAAFALAQKFNAELTVLNISEPSGLFADAGCDPNPVDATEELLLSEKRLCAIRVQMEAVNNEVGISYMLHQEKGRPGQAIVEYAERGEFDLVVLGSRGLGRFERLLLGSTSDTVLHHTNRSALIVR